MRRIIMIGNFDPKKYMEMQRRNPEMTREEYEFREIQCEARAGVRDGGLERKRANQVRPAVARLDLS